MKTYFHITVHFDYLKICMLLSGIKHFETNVMYISWALLIVRTDQHHFFFLQLPRILQINETLAEMDLILLNKYVNF